MGVAGQQIQTLRDVRHIFLLFASAEIGYILALVSNVTSLTFEETATTLGIAVPTAKQWWAYARAWLTVEIRASPSH